MTLNLNILRHYAHIVNQGGPLWEQSMFCFESSMCYWLRTVIAPVDGIEQIASNYSLKPNDVINEDHQCEKSKMISAKKIELAYDQAQILTQNGIPPIEEKQKCK